MNMLDIEHVSVSFTRYRGLFRQQSLPVVHGVALSVRAGEVVALVGSSGAGKSVLAHAILGLLPDNARMTGTIRYNGDVLDANRQQALRGKEIAFVPQSVNYLNPLMRVGPQADGAKASAAVVAKRRDVFARYRLAEHVERLLPFELSGGMARKVLVSTAVIGGARLIIADEPTPGMHPDDVRAALGDFRELADGGSAVLLIMHDIGAALNVADTIAVMYAGTVVEAAAAGDFSGAGERLRHPYSRALWRALPQNEFAAGPAAAMQAPYADDALPAGCAYAPRCELATDDCFSGGPVPMAALRGGTVRCWHAT